ncbi:MAG: polysaccharide biosynthesis protein [Anaerovorax sp.]|nr:polysaccharide biosynthesis protein [Anaerovorax sp.]
MRKKTFLKGAAILGVAGLMVQVMGAIFRIPLANIIGDEGMGYYQTAYPIYIFLLVFSTNGAPAAISKMVSERIAVGKHAEAHTVFRISFLVMLILGVVSSAIVFFGAKPIVTMLGNPHAYYAMAAIAPALLFVPIMAVFRGYFQGMQEMAPTAFSQLVEQAIRVGIGLILAVLLVEKGIEYAAGGACFGTSIGPIAGTLILIIVYLRKSNKIKMEMDAENAVIKESSKSIFKRLVYLTVPITIGVSILPIMNIADVGIVMNRMQSIGFSYETSNALYGQLTGMAGPIINIPQALALSIALSMVPAVAAAQSTKDKSFLKDNVSLGFRTAMILGVPCAFGLMSLSEPIMLLLYPMQAESAASAAPSLFYLSIGIVFLAIAQTMAGILQGLDKASAAVYSLLAGLVVKIILTYLLTGIPQLNVQGAAIGSSVAYGVVGILNLLAVKRACETEFDWKLTVIKPVLCGILMSVCVLISYSLLIGILGNTLATALSICVGAGVYGISLIFSKSILPNEIKALPKGEMLYRLLHKIHLV